MPFLMCICLDILLKLRLTEYTDSEGLYTTTFRMFCRRCACLEFFRPHFTVASRLGFLLFSTGESLYIRDVKEQGTRAHCIATDTKNRKNLYFPSKQSPLTASDSSHLSRSCTQQSLEASKRTMFNMVVTFCFVPSVFQNLFPFSFCFQKQKK